MNINNIEELLDKLKPMPEKEFIEKILVESKKYEECHEKTPAFPAVKICSEFSLVTGGVGCVLGATIMFFIMTCCVPPKVEIHEIVHYVTVDVPPPLQQSQATTTAKKTDTEIKKQEDDRPVQPGKNDIKQIPNKPSRGVFGWLSFLSPPKPDRWFAGKNALIDLDTMLEDYEKQAVLIRENRQNRPFYYRTARHSLYNESDAEQYSPEQYQQLLKELTL